MDGIASMYPEGMSMQDWRDELLAGIANGSIAEADMEWIMAILVSRGPG
jgi:hypothetical protein